MGRDRNAYRIFIGRPRGKAISYWEVRGGCRRIILRYVIETGCENGKWAELAQYLVQ
jgi:hypothetical protein